MATEKAKPKKQKRPASLEKRVENELAAVKALLRENTGDTNYLYGAQQALAWLRDPRWAAAPSKAFRDR